MSKKKNVTLAKHRPAGFAAGKKAKKADCGNVEVRTSVQNETSALDASVCLTRTSEMAASDEAAAEVSTSSGNKAMHSSNPSITWTDCKVGIFAKYCESCKTPFKTSEEEHLGM